MLKFNMIKQDTAGDADAGAAKTTPSTESTEAAADEAGGDSVDEFGYEKVAPEGQAQEDQKPTAKADAKVEEVKDPGTGYGVKPPEVVEEKPAPVVEPEVKLDLGYELDVKDLDAKESLKLQTFAKANALTKEAAQALVELKKSEISAAKQADAEFEKQQAKAVADLKISWDKELRTDPTFGGEKFAHNVQKAEKVLSEFMSATKKELTARGSMLPPYVMRDLAKLADHLYGSENLVNGEAKAKEIVEQEDDHLAFYK